jgi:hypothetical protein
MTIVRNNLTTKAEDVAESSPKCDSTAHRDNGRSKANRQDLLRRFPAIPHKADVQLMERTVRLEASTIAVLELARGFFQHHQVGATGNPDFHWRIVCESDPRVESTATPLCAFSDPGLQYVNIGQRGFLAVDLERREAAAYLSDQFLKRDARYRHRPPLDILFSMTAPSLGLTSLSGGCVGLNDQGVLIFGPPNSGKTTACYLAARCGMDFHADQVVFLDMKGNFLRAWGDPFPAVFRPKTAEFLPELQPTLRYSTYEDLEFYYFDKSPLQPRLARPVSPVCGLFLNRNTTGENELTRTTEGEALSRLRDCLLFDEDNRFDAQITEALTALAAIPIYNLRYREDPKIAAGVIKRLLS